MLSQPNPTTDFKECFQHGLVLEFNSCAGYDRSIRDMEHRMDSVTQEMPPFGLKGRLAGIGSDLGGRNACLLYTSPSPRDKPRSRMPSSA